MPAIGAPFAHVAVHIVETEIIGGETAHRGSPGQIGAAGFFRVGIIDGKVIGALAGEGFPAVKGGGCTGATGVFPA